MASPIQLLVASAVLALTACATQAAEPRHGLSAFGELKYKPGFASFDYVNPNAPKGGRLSQVGPGARTTFDSFNPFILKGDPAQGIELLTFDSLMTRAYDEADSVYGLVARTAALASDGMSVTFALRPEARFSDGTSIRPEDVCFSFETLKAKGHPAYRIQLRDVVGCEVPGADLVRYRFTGTQVRDLPLTVASLPILSQAYYARANFEETSLTPPVGSGPYIIGDFKQGTFVTFRRRPDYWARDLNVNRGRFNFDEIRYDYFRDRTAALESFKAGQHDFREEFTARDWATAYEIPQVRDGRIVRETLADHSPSGAQGFFINTRKAKFQDARVRRALDFAFDYEWMNKNVFYGLYTRTASFFENSELKAAGKPSELELALLGPFRSKLSPDVLDEPYTPPVSDGSGADRKRLQEAVKLLNAAGWTIRTEAIDDPDCGSVCRMLRLVGLRGTPVEQVLRNAKGETLDIEFLFTDPSSERILNPYAQTLKLIGIRTSLRRVDPAQYERRVKSHDFDVVTARFVMRLTPGPELLNFFSSEAARSEGSFNYSGIADPVVDALLDKVLEANTRAELVTATRALDRVLRSGSYWVPQWYKASHTIAYWSKFSRPSVKPKYDRGVQDTWWYDEEKASKLRGGPQAQPLIAPASAIPQPQR